MNIILASQSPRRAELLRLMGLDFTVQPANIDETRREGEEVLTFLDRISRAKACAVPASPTDVVIAADTIVTLDGIVLGKPRDPEDAKSMLRLLSGREHTVITGLAVRHGETVYTRQVETAVRFKALREAEIEAYAATGEPMDKAGAYGIQGRAAVLIQGIRGDYYNVVGLPVCSLGEILSGLGVKILEA